MKRFTVCLAIAGLLALGGQAFAVSGAIDDVPAATLLLPYFELDLANSSGVTTLFSINNASATSQLAHVTVWSTASIPVLDFDVYLTGYDVQTFNIRDILVGGILPQTGFGTSNPLNSPGSPKGAFSFAKVNFPNCNASNAPPAPPVYSIPAISPSFLAHLQALLTGKKSPVDGTCAARNLGDNIARGYITVDNVNSCSLLFPSSTGYFISGGLGIASNRNTLWGDYFYVNPGENFAQGETLVHVEADAAVFATAGEYTFYGRYVGGTAADNREALATTFATRYLSGGAFTGGTTLVAWRDSKFLPGFSCTLGPNYGDLFENQIVSFDELENPLTVITGGPSGEPLPGAQCTFCDEAQRVKVGTDIVTNAAFGWLYLNLNHATANDATLGAGYTNIAQAWVTAVMDASGRFSVGFDAIQLDNANTAVVGGICIGANGSATPCP
ncbi:MAG TPA: hypothetical protein VGV61_18775 [Thermoanaerobaculia bacterium]|nr:hypothetical protein [Thermoanaerobaculia bacterium]